MTSEAWRSRSARSPRALQFLSGWTLGCGRVRTPRGQRPNQLTEVTRIDPLRFSWASSAFLSLFRHPSAISDVGLFAQRVMRECQ